MAGTQVVSTHLPPAKDRSLAASLLRMSERRGLQDDFVVENVVYCGEEEPLYGWTNTAPIARYSKSSRPKDEFPKRKSHNRKPKPLEAKEGMSDIYDEFLWMATRADGHYHASATLQELYDEYKRRQRIDHHTKLKGMIDPVTFRYIPIDERDDGMETGVRLPVLKMTHANKQAKLLEALENFMSRKSDDSMKRTDTERYAVKGRDAAFFYDKWYFKDQHCKLSRNMKIGKRGKRLGKRKPGLGAKSYSYSEIESEESGGRRRQKMQTHPPTYVMQVKDEESKTLIEETITFERKTDYALSAPGGHGIDRWVARVAIRDTVSKGGDQSNTSTTASQITSKSSHKQIDKLHGLRTKNSQDAAKQSEYRLSQKKNKKRNGRGSPTNEVYHLSAVETDKFSIKYNVTSTSTIQRGHAHDGSESPEAGASNKEPPQVSKKKRVVKPTPVHSQHHIGSVNRFLPSTKTVVPLLKNSEGVETSQDDMKSSQLSPIKSKRSSYSSDEASSKVSKVRKKFRSVEAGKKLDREERALLAGKQTFESSEERQTKTPSSSTFNPDKMFQQMKDTADFITKAPTLSNHSKSIQTSPRMLSSIEDARIGDGNAETKSDLTTRKPLNPKKSKNRAQDTLQQIIEEENALVSQFIKQMNSNWNEIHREQLAPLPESSHDAPSIGIAKSRLHDIQGNGIIPTPRRSSVNQVMKRRVVPPMKEKSSVPTTTVGSEQNFIITDNVTFSTTKPKLPSVKSNGRPKKLEARKPGLSKSFRSFAKDRNESFNSNNKLQPGVHFASDGDFLITKPLSGIFEASISSIKPTRRIANVNQPFNIRQRA